MALKIRMRKQGRTNRPFYRIVLTDSHSPRDGKYMELLGWYNPLEDSAEKSFSLDSERISHWLANGAVLTEKVESLVKQKHPEVIDAVRQKEIARKTLLRQKRKNRKTAAKA